MIIKWRSVTILLLLIVNVNIGFGHTMRLELIHRHDPGRVPSGQTPKTQLERVKELLAGDGIRRRMMSHKLNRRQAWEAPVGGDDDGNASAEMPTHSGADYGIGQYLVTLKVGTPSQRFTLIADTGSDLTWMNCKYRCPTPGCADKRSVRRRRVFNADESSSFSTVPCLSDMCRIELMNLFSLSRCPTPMAPCAFDYRYSDGSAALGIFANETVTFGLTNGRVTRLHNVLIGCSDSSKGQSFNIADGVLGLGYSKHSFARKAARHFGGKFSYCLVDHLSPKKVTNFLTIGNSTSSNKCGSPKRMRFTDLVLDVIKPFYAVNIIGISVGRVMLRIPSEVWNVRGVGGAILDSGTSLTLLAEPAYEPVMAALKRSLTRFRRSELDIKPLEYCFNSSGFDESLVPRLRFHFAGGARFSPPVKSYVIDAADAVKCLGFVSVSWPGTSVIGNIMQQNHLWEFDLAGSRVGFAPSTCA